MHVTFYRSERDPTPLPQQLDWPFFCEKFREARACDCTPSLCPGSSCVYKLGPAWSPAELLPGEVRRNRSVVRLHLAVLDLDHLSDDVLLGVASRLAELGLRHLAHPTHSDRAGDRCWRVVLPLSRPVLASEWKIFFPALVSWLGVPADPACKDLARLYFLPSHPTGAEYMTTEGEGDPVDVDAILRGAVDLPALPNAGASGGAGHAAVRVGQEGTREAPDAVLAKEGSRNATLTSLAGTMRKRGMSAEAIEAALLEENAKRCVPPLDDAEVRRIVESISRYEPEPDAIPKGNRTWGLDVRLDDLLTQPEQSEEELWLVQGTLAAGESQVVGGEPKSGKTLLLEHMAVCVASGTRWLDKFTVKRGRVLVLPREDHARETARRLRRLCAGLGVDARKLRDWLYVECKRPFRLDEPSDVRDMLAQIRDLDISLVVLDPLAELHRCDENNASEMGRVMDAWVELTNDGRTGVAVVHHWRKPPEGGGYGGGIGRRLRGSTRVFQRVRHSLGVEAWGDGTVRLEADGNLPGRIRASLVDVADALDANGRQCIKVSWRSYDDTRRRG